MSHRVVAAPELSPAAVQHLANETAMCQHLVPDTNRAWGRGGALASYHGAVCESKRVGFQCIPHLKSSNLNHSLCPCCRLLGKSPGYLHAPLHYLPKQCHTRPSGCTCLLILVQSKPTKNSTHALACVKVSDICVMQGKGSSEDARPGQHMQPAADRHVCSKPPPGRQGVEQKARSTGCQSASCRRARCAAKLLSCQGNSIVQEQASPREGFTSHSRRTPCPQTRFRIILLTSHVLLASRLLPSGSALSFVRGQVPGLSAPTHLQQLARFLLGAAAMPPVANLGVSSSSSSSRPRLWSQLLRLGGEGAGSIAGGPQAAMLVQDLGGGACPSHRQHQHSTRQGLRGSTLKPLNPKSSATAAGASTSIRSISAGTSTVSQVGAGSVGTINPTSNSITLCHSPLVS